MVGTYVGPEPGTEMYSDDWLDQDPRARAIHPVGRKLVRDICSAYMMGSTADAVILWSMITSWMKENGITPPGEL